MTANEPPRRTDQIPNLEGVSMRSAMMARTMPLCPDPSGEGLGERVRTFVSGALGAGLLAAALAFPVGEAQARDECGTWSTSATTHTCSDAAYASGIRYDAADGWGNGIAGDITLTVTGGSATAISSAAAAASNSWGSGIVLRTAHHATDTRTVALTVGSGSNAVRITQTTGTLNAGFDNTGVVIHHRGSGASPTTVTLGSGVDIGTMAAPMKRSGVHVLVEQADNTADHTITSAADIYSAGYGILMDARGSGNTVVTNSGSIVNAAVTGGTTGQAAGIRILDWTGTRGNERPATATTTVTNSDSGSISVSQAQGIGIHVDAEGLGLYKTVNSGTVSATSTASHGIFVNAGYHWGAAGTEAVEIENSGTITTGGTSAHGIYVETYAAPQGRGDGNIAITNSGSISSANAALLVNSNMGDTTVKHTGGSITSTAEDGIRVQQGGTGAVTVESRADVTAENYGIRVLGNPTQAATTVTVAVAAGVTTRTNEPQVTISSGTTTTTYATLGAVSVTHSGGEIEAKTESGIWIQQKGADATVTSSADVTAEKYGIFVVNDRALATVAIAAGVTTNTWSNTGAVSVTHSAGTISAETESGIWVRQVAGTGAVTVISSSDVTAKVHGIYVGNEGSGDTRITTTGGKIMAGADGIHLGIAVSNTSGGTIVNAAAIDADGHGLVAWYSGEGEIRIENSGAITAGNIGIHADEGAAGAITIVNGADVMGDNHGIFARNTQGEGAVSVTHSAGEVRGKEGNGIAAFIGRWRNEDSAESPDPISTATVEVEVTGGSVHASETRGRVAIEAGNFEGGSAEVTVSKGAEVFAKHNAGIYALLSDRQNTNGRIMVTQGGTIEARKGVYASVSRAGTEERAAAGQPLIDVEWTGTFTEAERTLTTLNLNGVAHAIESAQEAQAGEDEVIRGAAHTAGIDAEAMSWRVLNRIATRGDDPGAFADKAAQDALFAEDADAATQARAADIIERFRSVLTDETLGTIPGAAGIDTDGTTGLSDAEIVAYLSMDDDARRTELRDILARHLSETEKAVLRAVATGGSNAEVDAALAGVTGASDAWKNEVRALLNNYNTGNIRVAMNGGSIDSTSGDGIRAWYARQHDRNGAISVSVAEGASVTGGKAGIYVANAGAMGTGAERILKQTVTVNGMVTGGMDAAVHLSGGGRLTVGEKGKVHAGSSGRAILVNDPGRSIIEINGEVRGGSGSGADAVAAVDVTGGGSITVGRTGSVDASRGDGIRAKFARQHDDNGAIAVTVAEGATVTGGAAGVYLSGAGTGLRVEKKYTSPEIQDANEELGPDDRVTLSDHLDQVVRVQGTVTGGTDAAVHLAGGGALIVTGAGKLVAGSSGRAVLVNDPGPAVIYIEGEVTGGAGPEGEPAPAAVHLTGGGSVTVGLTGRVRAGGAMSAIRGDNAPTAVIVHSESTVGTLTREQAREALARVEGGIVGDAVESVTIAEVRDGVTTGHERQNLPVGEDGEVDVSPLPPSTFRCDGAMDGRCRLYEALPSILLAMNDLPSYAERTSAVRDANGAWARVEMARGEWQADSSTRPNVTYDHRRTGGRAGVDVLAGETGRVGVSMHVLRGKAEMAGGGEAELDGTGAGLSATWLVGDLYVDVQAGATWYDAKLDPATGSGRLVNEVDGRGYALGLDVGNRMVMGGDLVVTPRAGLAWSKVDLDDFMDEVGSGAKVSVRDARSTKGRVGVMVDTAVGSEDAPGRVFGSVDVEHEFSDETSVDVSGNLLETTVKPTGVRLGLGGTFSLGEDVVLRARADYTTSGGDTSEYGGGLELNLRF